MYTLTYESLSVGNPTEQQMEILMEKAISNNIKNNITGCLVHYMGGFIQILEGEKEEVLRVFEKIKRDKRHTEVHLFSDNDIVERTFDNWGMGYFIVNKDSPNEAEIQHFKSNILLLSQLSKQTNVTVLLFWRRIRLLLNNTES